MKTLNLRWLLPLLVLLYSMNFMDRSVLSVVGDALKADLLLTDAQLGFLHSILMIMLIFLIMPAAISCDIFGRRRTLCIAASIWTGAMALTGTAMGFIQLVFARALGSVNEAVSGAGGTAWLSSCYPADKRGKVIGLFQISAPLGMSVGMLLGGVVLATTGSWRLSFLLFIVPGIICSLLFPFLPDNPAPVKKDYFSTLLKLLRKRTIVICGIAVGLYIISKFAYQAWLPVLIMRSYDNLSAVSAGAMSGAFMFAGIIGPIISGRFSDWYNNRSPSGRVYAIVICMGIMTISKFVLYYITGHVPVPVFFAYGLLDGALTMLPLPIYFSMVQDVVNDEVRGGACGIMGAIAYLAGGAWGPLLVGFFSDFFGGGAAGLRLAEIALLIFPLLSTCVFACCISPYAKERITA